MDESVAANVTFRVNSEDKRKLRIALSSQNKHNIYFFTYR